MSQIQEILRFSVAGIAVITADFSIYYFLSQFLPYNIAKAVSFTCAGIVGYMINKFWVFKNQQSSAAEMVRFLLVNLIALGMNVAVNHLLIESFRTSKLFALITATAVTNVMIYVSFKWWVFKQ